LKKAYPGADDVYGVERFPDRIEVRHYPSFSSRNFCCFETIMLGGPTSAADDVAALRDVHMKIEAHHAAKRHGTRSSSRS